MNPGNRVAPRLGGPAPSGPRVLLTTVASDAHTWNLVYLWLLLQENGYDVTTVGACPPVRTVVAAAQDVRPDAIVVSTVNGHGCLDGTELIRALRAAPLSQDVPIALGGKLGIAGDLQHQQTARLYGVGCDRVFGDGHGPEVLLEWLYEAVVAVGQERVAA